MQKKKSGFISLVLLFLLSGSILFPIFNVGSLGLRLSDILSLSLLPLLICGWIQKQRLYPSSSVFFFFILSTCISLINSYLVLNVPSTFRDINEISRYIILFLVLMFVSNMNYKKAWNIIELFFSKTYLIFFIFGVLQRFFSSQIPLSVLKLWGGEAHIRDLLESSHHRIFLTGSDPNIGAGIAALYFFYFFSSFILKKNKIDLVRAFMMFALIVFTSSRTVMIGTFCVVLFYILTTNILKVYHKMILFFLIIVGTTIVFINTPYMSVGLSTLFEGTNNSVLVRLSNFKDAIDLFTQSPIWGWGPAKSIHTTIVDGEYFLILRRYGVIGSVFFLSFFWYIVKISRQLINTKIGLLCFLYTCLCMFIMITNNVLSGYQLGIPLVVFVGVMESLKNNYYEI